MRSPCIVLTLLCLLAFTPAAAADCAWVLWTALSDPDVQPSEGEKVWRIHDAFGSQSACTQGRTAVLVRWRDEAQRTMRLGELTVSAELIEPDGKMTLFREGTGRVVRAQTERVLCLPDTLDPRGPKTK
jgi:hypothetical protein